MDKETAPSPPPPMSRIADDNAPTVEVARPNAKTIAAMEEARAIKAGYGKESR